MSAGGNDWRSGPASVLLGTSRACVVTADCRDVFAEIPRGRVILVTDPPYGIDLGEPNAPRDAGGLKRTGHGRARKGHGLSHGRYEGFADSYELFVSDVVPRLNEAIDIAIRSLVWTGPHIHEQRKPDAIGGAYVPAATGRHSWGFKSFLPALMYGAAPELNKGSRPTVLVSTETSDEDIAHPVPKPIGFMLWAVALASREGDVIFDPFCGSGTTGVAALRLGRRFIGVDRVTSYVEQSRERLDAEVTGSTLAASRAGQGALFIGASK